MADTNDNGNENEPSFLRGKWEEEQAKNKDLQARLDSLEKDSQLRDSGLGHLSQRQRRVLLREMQEDGTEFSTDAAKEVAKDLGYPLDPPTTTPPPSTQQQGNGEASSQSDNGLEGMDNLSEAEGALAAMMAMQRMRDMVPSQRVNADFAQKMANAQTPEELRDLIRTEGPRHGVVHEWDVP